MFGENLRRLREDRGLNQTELAEILGTTKQSVNRYEKKLREPNIKTASEFAKRLGVPLHVLTGEDTFPSLPDNILPMPNMKKVPLLGTIACGEPILAAENIEDMVNMPENVDADFALRCKGESMINARIFDGDIVYIKQCPTVANGTIAAVLIGDEATLKRVRLSEDRIILMPENNAFDPLVFIGEEMNTVRILGKAVAFTSNVI